MAMILNGRLICANSDQAAVVREYLPEHIRLTRSEPGCLEFDVSHAGAMTWQVRERFIDRAAFEAHQARMRASEWGRRTQGIAREFEMREE